MYSAEVNQVAKYSIDTFTEIVKTLRESNTFPKPFEFTVSKSDEAHFQVFIVGNKIAGSDYEKNMWKTVPILACSVQHNSDNHPTEPGKERLDLRVNYSGSWGSEYSQVKYVENGLIKEHLQRAINRAIKEFTIQETI